MALLNPLLSLGISFIILAVMLYKRVSMGIALVSTALLMSVLSIGPLDSIRVIMETTIDPVTVSLVLVTYGVMLLSLLYKETQALESLSKSFSGLLRNPKLIVSVLPAVIGLLPVPGGALMSAPLVGKESESLNLESEKKTYINVWFRHIIYLIYPMNQALILTSALTGASMSSMILSQIPVAVTMTLTGYMSALRKAVPAYDSSRDVRFRENAATFFVSFMPILVMILSVSVFGFNLILAVLVGIILLLLVARPNRSIIVKLFSEPAPYSIALAAYGAMLLRSATMASDVSTLLGQMIGGSNIHEALLLSSVPAFLGFVLGSPAGGIAISVPIVAGTLDFTSKSASLLFVSAYLGYLGAPTHLCFVLTAEYFKCHLVKVYRYLVPSLAISFIIALLVFLVL